MQFRNKPEAFTNPSTEKRWNRHWFCTKLSFPERRGWFENLKKHFSLHDANPFGREWPCEPSHLRCKGQGDRQPAEDRLAARPLRGIWSGFMVNLDLLCSSVNPRPLRHEAKIFRPVSLPSIRTGGSVLCTEAVSYSVWEHREHLGLAACAREPGSTGRVTEWLGFGVSGKVLPRGGLWNWLSRTAGLTG